MKIALTIDSFSPSHGGGEGYAVNLARYLARCGHNVHVFARTGEAGEPPVSFHRVPAWKGSELVRVLSFALNCQKQLRGQGFDIIQGFGKTWTMNVFRPGGGVHRAWFRQNLRSMEGLAYRAYKGGERLLALKDPIFFCSRANSTAAPCCAASSPTPAWSKAISDAITRWIPGGSA